jgi:nitroreductase
MLKEKLINGYPFVLFKKEKSDTTEIIKRTAEYLHKMDKRRSVREFSSNPVPREVIENIVLTASTSPSGANKQPWTFCLVSDPRLKKAIREAAEKEEQDSYNSRMPKEWLEDLMPLQTSWEKEFLETAPWLIVVLKRIYEPGKNGEKRNNYYVQESVGIASGILLTAIHNAGLVALTHTPNPMNFLSDILGRPEYEKPFLIIPVGYPAEECYVPKLIRKGLKDIAVFYEE